METTLKKTNEQNVIINYLLKYTPIIEKSKHYYCKLLYDYEVIQCNYSISQQDFENLDFEYIEEIISDISFENIILFTKEYTIKDLRIDNNNNILMDIDIYLQNL